MITGMPRIAIAAWDFDALLQRFRDDLGLPVIDLSDFSRREYGANLAMCVPEGGSNIELMSPLDPDAPLSKSLRGFLERRGEGLFALMLEAPAPDEEAETLAARGLRTLPLMPGAFGRDLHPSATHGVLIRIYPVNSFQDRNAPQMHREAPTLSGIVRVMIAVQDLERAVEVYGTSLGMAVEPVTEDAEHGIRSALCRPPSGGTIELVAAGDPGLGLGRAIATHLENHREGMYALVLESADLAATARLLAAGGIRVAAPADNAQALEIDPADTFGARIRIHTART